MGGASRARAKALEIVASSEDHPNPKGHVVVCLGENDAEEAAYVLSRSFSGTHDAPPEPTYDWVLGPSLRGRFDDPRRMALVEYYMRWDYNIAVTYGIVLGVRDAQTGSLLSVTHLIPQSALWALNTTSWWAALSPAVRRTAIKMGAAPPEHKHAADYDMGATSMRMGAFSESLDRLHRQLKREAPREAGAAEWYVSAHAVMPEAQGRGVTRSAFDTIFAIVDDAGAVCSLEAAGERNRRIYEHLGFEVRENCAVWIPRPWPAHADEEHPPDTWAMVRNPRAKKSAPIGAG